ncbi:MAG: TolC family protein, partial [Burkholderiales bacterium]|nr:TolC family protein [Burkholderiales bacterium]
MQMQAQAQPTLSLYQALRLAQDRSHQLVAQDAAARAAREMAAAAGELPDPTLKAGVNNLPIDGPDRYSLTNDFMTMRSIGVMQEFTRADKRRARSARFEREAEVAHAGRAVALADLRRDTTIAWLERCYQERMRAVLRAQRAEAGLQVEAAEAAYRGGRGSQADVFAARSAVAQIDDRIRQADGQIAAARTRLARWVGVHADEPLAPPPPLDTVALDAAHLDTELQRNPQIALMAGQQAVARAEADVARSDKHPDWSVELMYNQRGPAYSNMVSLNVSIPLQLDPENRQDRDVAARLARVEQLRAERDEALRDRVAQARGWLQEWHSDRDRLAHFDRTLIPLAGERTRA